MFFLQKLFVFIGLIIIHSRTFSQVMKSFMVSFSLVLKDFGTSDGTCYGTCYVIRDYYYSGCYFSFANNSSKIQIFKNNTTVMTLYPVFRYLVRYRRSALKCKVHFELSSGQRLFPVLTSLVMDHLCFTRLMKIIWLSSSNYLFISLFKRGISTVEN